MRKKKKNEQKKKLIITFMLAIIAIILIIVVAIIVNTKVGKATITLSKENRTIDEIITGNIQEITENEFTAGIYHDLTAEEVENVKKILTDKEYTCKNSSAPKKDKIKYTIDFCDISGQELLKISVLKNGDIYTQNNEKVKSKKMKELIENMTKE